VNLGDFLLTAIEYITRILPRFKIIRSTHGGVAFVRGKPKLIPSGCVYWYWPVWTEIDIGPIAQQTVDLKDQRVMMMFRKKLTEVSVSAVLEYKITKTMDAYSNKYDLDDSIRAKALLVVADTIVGRNLTNTINNKKAIDTEIKKALGVSLKAYGVKVITAGLSDITTCRVLHHIGMKGEM